MRPELLQIAQGMFESVKAGIDSLNMSPTVLNEMPYEVLIFNGRQDRIVSAGHESDPGHGLGQAADH